MARAYDLWVDFQRGRPDGITTTLARYARPGVELRIGEYLLVGADDSEIAVAEIVDIDPAGLVSLRIQPGPAAGHASKLRPEVRLG